MNYIAFQEENQTLKSELQLKYKEIVDLKRDLNRLKAKEFIEKKLSVEN